MTKITRHVGTISNLGTRAIVVFRELPEEPDHCLVLQADSLPEYYRDAVSDVVNHAGQNTKDLYEALHRERMPTNENMLMALHQGNFLRKHRTDEIMMHPTRNDNIRLDELNEHLRNVDKPASEISSDDLQTKFNPYKDKSEGLDSEDANNIAVRLLQEADEHRIESERKAERALKLRPELREKYEAHTAPVEAAELTATELTEKVAQLDDIESLVVLDALMAKHQAFLQPVTEASDDDKFSIDLREVSQRTALDQIKMAWREANPTKVAKQK